MASKKPEARDPVDKFGEFVMQKLRDPALDYVDGLLRGHWKAPASAGLQEQLGTLTAKHKEMVRRSVRSSIDTAIHDFLFALQERADFEGDIKVLVDGKDVVDLSDGIHGESFGPDGWMARFSTHGAPPEAEAD
jgi:hypothetical protein